MKSLKRIAAESQRDKEKRRHLRELSHLTQLEITKENRGPLAPQGISKHWHASTFEENRRLMELLLLGLLVTEKGKTYGGEGQPYHALKGETYL